MLRLSALLLLINTPTLAQDSLKYWVQFTDKNNNGYSVSQPELFLSQRALDRRSSQGIAIDEKDLPLTEAYVDSLRSAGANILNYSKWFNAVTFSTNDTQLVQQLAVFPFVQGTQAVRRWRGTLEDESQVVQGNQRTFNDYGNAFTQIAMLNGDVVHDIGYTGRGVLIAVIDAGFSGTNTHAFFDLLRAENRIVATRDFVDGDADVYAHSTHGTAVLSTIGAWAPGEMIGTAYQADFLLLRSEAVGSEFLIEEDNWIAAAEFADSLGADILTTSLGYNTFDDTLMNHSYADLDGNTTRITIGSDVAASRGMLVVNSAGNEGSSSWRFVNAPADGDSVLAVGSVDLTRSYSPFSSQGPTFDGRIKPDVAAMGQDVTVAGSGGGAVTSNGTSFSAPIIAGMAACLWEAYPNKSGMEIHQAIIQSAHQFTNPDNFLGYGIPNFLNALHLLDDADHPAPDKAYVSPVLFSDFFTLYFAADRTEEGSIAVYDATGRLFFESPFSFRQGSSYAVPYNGTALPSGAYFVRIRTESGDETVRLLKLKP